MSFIDKAKDVAGDVIHKVAGTASTVGDKVSDVAGDLKDKVMHHGDAAKSDAAGATDHLSTAADKAADAADTATE